MTTASSATTASTASTSASSTHAPTPRRSDLTIPAPTSGWKGFGLLTWFSFWKLLTNPFSLGFAILLPIFMYLMFGNGQEYSTEWTVNANVAATVLVNMSLYGSIMTTSSMGANIALERTSGISRLFAMTPLSSFAIIVSRLIASLGISAVVIGIVFTVGRLTDARMTAEAWVSSFLIIIGLSLLPAAIGLAFAFTVRSDGAFAATSGLTVVGSFASGMFIPLSQMGDFWQTIAPWSPFYGMVMISASPLYGWDDFKWEWVVNYVAWLAIFAAIAMWAQRRDTKR